ncbi:MAG: FAD-binding protein [Erysipelothrix sp.]|jgi:flavin-dependent dehydrogenase|nr:FAD-binding protein [Erysipelothrix sp.]
MKHVNVVVIGCGVAGSIFAMHAPKHQSLCIIDKKNLKEAVGLKKPCGGLLAPDAQKTLAKLKISLPLEVCASPQLFGVKTYDLQSKITRHYQRHYINLHRDHFDRYLASLLPPHVDVVDEATVNSLDLLNKKLTYIRHNETHELSFDVCIGADGAKSLVRSHLHAPKMRHYLAIQEQFELKDYPPHLGCFFDASLTDSYAWINIKNDILEFGGAFPLKDSLKRYETFKSKMIDLGYPLKTPLHKEACLVNSPKTLSEIYLGQKDVLLIGEAAGWISPSSLEGMSYAMDSALIAAESLKSSDPYLSYRKLSRSLKLKVFLKQLKSIVLYTPWIRWCVMKSGLDEVKVRQ